MGDSARSNGAYRFVEEFGEDIKKLAVKDRHHDVVVGVDDNNQVRLFVTVGEFDYMSEFPLYDPDSQFLEDLSDLMGLLGIENNADNYATLKGRLEKAEL